MRPADVANCTPDNGPTQLLTDGFRNAVVVVIGGRGGIGAEVCRQAAAMGARVVAVSSTTGDAGLTQEVDSGAVALVKADIRVTEDLRRLAESIDSHLGRVDVLVNTAGSSTQVSLRDLDALTDNLITEVFNANAIGVLASIRELAPLLRKGTHPVIVNVGSVAARTGVGSNLAYVGAKAAVDAMSIGLAKALAPAIRVIGVAPSALETGFVKGRDAQFIERTIAATPLGRLTTIGEVAAAVLVAARVLTATTGVVIAVDGGRHL